MKKFICNSCGYYGESVIEEMFSSCCSAYCTHCGQLNLIWNGTRKEKDTLLQKESGMEG